MHRWKIWLLIGAGSFLGFMVLGIASGFDRDNMNPVQFLLGAVAGFWLFFTPFIALLTLARWLVWGRLPANRR